ncbi:MAG: DUF4386 domain-containing protein [Terracidiphilus sp.]|jgi:hypothetical protein
MNSTRNQGRVAGLWYLVLVVLGPLRLMYIPSKLFVFGNPAATVNNIAANEGLFRISIAADLLCAVVLIFLVMAFYRLFKGIDQHLAVLVAILGGVMPAVLYIVNAISDLGVLTILKKASALSAFDKPQRDAISMLLLYLHNDLNTAAAILWGLWLFPLAILVYRSRFLPQFLGVWLALGGVSWVTWCFTGVLLPEYRDRVLEVCQPAMLGEMALTLWLVIKGARPPELGADRA